MLSAGTRVGPYEIVSWLGAGGMGEVYRARDTKLGREVALKTLPEELSRQPERLARLRQEARILASLNHPGIATLHGLEDSDSGVPVLVMELVEGESLQDRLQRGRLSPQEALTVGRESALALEAAHQKGVLHRDLKPGNIRILPDGRVKLLDFGLARALRDATLDSRLDTETSPHSEPGAVLGTAPYMSPEQARGQDVDRRSDAWAFGCVLFEMLAGKRAFQGASFSDTLAAVLEHDPDWAALPSDTPAAALRLLRRCLQKDRDKRLRDIGDAGLELQELLAGPVSAPSALRGPRPIARWATTAVLAALLASVGLWLIRRPLGVPKEVVRLSMEAWGDLSDFHSAPLLSPDGKRIVYMANPSLAIRRFEESEWHVLPGTMYSQRPFFSPDGQWLGFSAGNSVKKLSLAGGGLVTGVAAVTVRENAGTTRFGASWGPDDSIVFTRTGSSGLWRVPASGGEPRELTQPDRVRGEKSHRWPHHLPGGKALLFSVVSNRSATYDEARIEALVLGTGERRTVIEGGSAPLYVDSGHLLFRRGAAILAAPFDLDRLAVTGGPVAVVDGVRSGPTGEPYFTVASTGTLAYVPRVKPAFRLVQVDRAGRARPLTPVDAALLWEPRVSPDGRSVAAIKVTPNNQVWRFDIERESFTRLTFEWDTSAPTWTPDGESLIFSSGPDLRLHRLRADGSGVPEPLSSAGARQFPRSITADGKLLAYEEGEDIWILPLGTRGEPRPFLKTLAAEGAPAISPNGRVIAYQSDESGETEVYLRSFPDGRDKLQVSSGGGFLPVWPGSGKELVYAVSLEGGSKGRLMAVEVSAEPPIRASRPRLLFEHRYEALDYDVFPDGQHFVMSEVDREAMRVAHFNVILNWFEELKHLVPPK
jgi:serine/threonine-protein kinase